MRGVAGRDGDEAAHIAAKDLSLKSMAALAPSHLHRAAVYVDVLERDGVAIGSAAEEVLQRLIGLDDDIGEIIVTQLINRRVGGRRTINGRSLHADQLVVLPDRIRVLGLERRMHRVVDWRNLGMD